MCSAERSCTIPKRCRDDRHRCGRHHGCVPSEDAAQVRLEQVEVPHHPAAENDPLGREERDRVHKAQPEEGGRLLDDLGGERIASASGVGDRDAAERGGERQDRAHGAVLQLVTGARGDRRTRAQHLPAPVRAAIAPRARQIEQMVPGFSMGPFGEASPAQKRHPDARADGYAGQTVDSAARTEPPLPKGGRVSVVQQRDGALPAAFEDISQRSLKALGQRVRIVDVGADATFGNRQENEGRLPDSVSTPFVLHVGDLHERRNLAMAVTAVLEARRRVRELSSLSLVLAGVDRGVGEALLAQARAAGAVKAVVALGHVPEDTLRVLYDRALALVYPSLYEGFGLPLVEAMASGTPVLASEAAASPEVVGDGGLLLDPHRSSEWADAFAMLALDPDRRGQLRAKGLLRARQFSWETTARRTLDVYRTAAGL